MTMENKLATRDKDLPILGRTWELGALINQHHIDRLILVDKDLPQKDLEWCRDVADRMGVTLNCLPGTWDPEVKDVRLTRVSSVSLLEIGTPALNWKIERLKRFFDIVLSALFLVILAPLFGTIALAIRLTSPGPVYFVEDRAGKGGRHFRFLKFRTMIKDASKKRVSLGTVGAMAAFEDLSAKEDSNSVKTDGHIFKDKKDARITQVGRVLRRTSLDEVPQLWNVLRGDMSLVGPRPLPSRDLGVDGPSGTYKHWALERSRVRPGMTGVWQVMGRSDLRFRQMVRLDLFYVKKRSFGLDLMILGRTLPAVLSGRGAY